MTADDLCVITDIEFAENYLSILLADGSRFVQNFNRTPHIRDASGEDRAKWVVTGGGRCASWAHLGSKGVSIDAYDLAWDAYCEQSLSTAQGENWDMSRLSPRDRDIVALWRLEADGYNGGFLQFFCNWGEENCSVALGALQAIGASATHEIVARQREIVMRLEDHPQLQSYDDIYRLLTEAEMEQIGNELDPQFWDTALEIPELAVRHFWIPDFSGPTLK